MCTAINLTKKYSYFGRNLDYEYSFGEEIIITPRKFKFKNFENRFAMIGMGINEEGYPLYFDATNEKGVSVAGLSFPLFCKYMLKNENKTNVASYEFIPYILSQCVDIDDVKQLLENINITDEHFNEKFPPTPLHWLISCEDKAITVEQTEKGLNVYDNKTGVLTNSPDFEKQMFNLNNYINLSSLEPENKFSEKLALESYSKGMGGIGLPGDLSSMSRFVRANFIKQNSVCLDNEIDTVNQFFHILYSVYQQRGCSESPKGYEMTHYSSCCNTQKGIYYYTTYNNSSINAIDMYKENLNSEKLICYKEVKTSNFHLQN